MTKRHPIAMREHQRETAFLRKCIRYDDTDERHRLEDRITQLLRDTWFTPTAWDEALFMPPVGGGWFLRSAVAWERIGAALSLPFAGVHIVEATKQVYRAIPAHRERTRLIPALEPVLVPSRRSLTRSPD